MPNINEDEKILGDTKCISWLMHHRASQFLYRNHSRKQ